MVLSVGMALSGCTSLVLLIHAVETPVISPGGGAYPSAQTVTISDATAGSTIYYTTDGTTPTTSSNVYSVPITVSSNETIKAIATASTYTNSNMATATYTISAATPIISPASGAYTSVQTVTITDATAGSTIHYTTDGTTPTTSSNVYSVPITVSSNETIEAIAVASGYSNSGMASATYSITLQTAMPTFNPPQGTYASVQTVTISDATVGAVIHYTTDGSTPTVSSAVYSVPIPVASTETIEAIAVASGYSNSGVASAKYTLSITTQTATPTFNPLPGTFKTNSPLMVTISDTMATAQIYYTTDGSTPTTFISSTTSLYSSPISVTSSEVLTAIAVASGYSDSAVAIAPYVIKLPTSVDQWTWVSGANSVNQSEIGALGVAAAGNTPGARSYAVRWTDNTGKLWLFGGGKSELSTSNPCQNDLWSFDTINNQWTWVSGTALVGQPGVYGSQGIASINNTPGGRCAATSWTDSSGNLWLFGGVGVDYTGTGGNLNDLWMYSVSAGQWTWVAGAQIVNQLGAYGTKGTAAVGNSPGARYSAVPWTDATGNLWLFGGSTGQYYAWNDLWKYSASAGGWAWMGGSAGVDQPGAYGVRGTPASGNVPGGRYAASSWADTTGNLWLFGGFGEDSNTQIGLLSDMWKYSVSTGYWTWESGPNTRYGLGTYGYLEVPAVGNIPGARTDALSWIDTAGNFWLFGGYCEDGHLQNIGELNDLWTYSPSTSRWTWMGGTSTTGDPGSYGTTGVKTTSNLPAARQDAVGWIDGSNNLWLFGGTFIFGGNYSPTLTQSGWLNDMWEYQP